MHIGIVGGGFVGSATALLQCDTIQITLYDLDPTRCSPPGTRITDLQPCDLVFICVPTPTNADGSCNTSIVRRCITSLKEAGVEHLVLRSTVPPGTSDDLGVSFMPEFLTEANWRADFKACKQWVFAAHSTYEEAAFRTLLGLAQENDVIDSNSILFTGKREAELIKYTRNNFLALKISFFNEIYGLCKSLGIDYEAVRAGTGADPRIGVTHTLVPGYDGHFGFGGTCLPKDTQSLLTIITKEAGLESFIVDAMVRRNNTVDRPEHDWENDPRAFTKGTSSNP